MTNRTRELAAAAACGAEMAMQVDASLQRHVEGALERIHAVGGPRRLISGKSSETTLLHRQLGRGYDPCLALEKELI
jgi:hypothetical protein